MHRYLLFAFRFFWQEWRSNQWRIIFLALTTAIAVLSSMNFYVERVSHALDKQALDLLGGNLVVTSNSPISKAMLDKATSLKLSTAQLWSFPTVAWSGENMQLVNIDAVSANYPLMGNDDPCPEVNLIVVDQRVLTSLKTTVQHPLVLGSATFTIAKILSPQFGGFSNGLNFAPRVLMNLSDVAKTKILLPGSRVSYRLIIAGDDQQVQLFRSWAVSHLQGGQRLIDIKSQQSTLQSTLQRVYDYLQLVLMLSLLMAGVAIAISSDFAWHKYKSTIALWRVFGASQRQIFSILCMHLLIISLLAGSIGVLIGYLLQIAIAKYFLSDLLNQLAAVTVMPMIIGLLSSMLLLFALAIPHLLTLPKISPVKLLRGFSLSISANQSKYYFMSFTALMALILFLMHFSVLSLLLVNGLVVAIGMIYAFVLAMLAVLAKIKYMIPMVLRGGINNIIRHPQSTALQLVGMSLVIMAMLLLGIIRNDLLNAWQAQLPSNTPNYFAFNIAPQDVTPMQQLLQNHKIMLAGIYPMVRGRLTSLNHQAILTAVPLNARGNNALHRELNLSQMWQLPTDNDIVQGKSWNQQDQGKALISIEKQLADQLTIKLGDQLTFQIGDQQLTGTVTNFRTLKWNSFHPNFYVIFPPGVLDNYPMTYITSFHLTPSQTSVISEIATQYPNVTIIDVASMLRQVQNLIVQSASLLQYLFSFTLLMGIFILLASLQVSFAERLYENQLLRICGASKWYIRRNIFVEFICLGIIAGLLASLLAMLLASFLAYKIFDMSYHWHFMWLLIGVFAGIVFIALPSLFFVRKLILSSPLRGLVASL